MWRVVDVLAKSGGSSTGRKKSAVKVPEQQSAPPSLSGQTLFRVRPVTYESGLFDCSSVELAPRVIASEPESPRLPEYTILRIIQVPPHSTIESVHKRCQDLALDGQLPDVITFDRSLNKDESRASRWAKAIRPAIWADVFDEQIQHALTSSLPSCPSVYLPRSSLRSRCVALGGTFDGIHAGHFLLLYAAIQQFNLGPRCSYLCIGLMKDDAIAGKPLSGFSYAYETRQSILIQSLTMMLNDLGFAPSAPIKGVDYPATWCGGFISLDNLSRRIVVHISELDSEGIGIAGELKELESLVVTVETQEGGKRINEFRMATGLSPLNLIVCPLLTTNDSEKLSSTGSREHVANLLPDLDTSCYDKAEIELIRAVVAPNLLLDGSLRLLKSTTANFRLSKLAKDLLLR